MKHLSHASITRLTVNRYISAMNSFFRWRQAQGLCRNPNFPDLDMQLADYLNDLYHRDQPLYLGINCIAGLKKKNSPAVQQAYRYGLHLAQQLGQDRLESSGDAFASKARQGLRVLWTNAEGT